MGKQILVRVVSDRDKELALTDSATIADIRGSMNHLGYDVTDAAVSVYDPLTRTYKRGDLDNYRPQSGEVVRFHKSTGEYAVTDAIQASRCASKPTCTCSRVVTVSVPASTVNAQVIDGETKPEGGIVIVSTADGMFDIPVVTTAGQTVADAIKAEVVATRSEQMFALLTSYAVILNGESISWSQAEVRRVHQNDHIALSPAAAQNKDC